ncbi:putative bifunctional diguanylate cyclase/phosphodiesterase [Cellulomonas endophytica]|uniref:putative bifunctional diguanylate cyclase/phosphodiesterase n=1 Tax=Cellulomonas endophytica TaxID=2494735 RepID=UPI00196AD922|nr:bifunctional diguanylate cyclase/phosphodiesterase [Cellulomonas endophytica]
MDRTRVTYAAVLAVPVLAWVLLDDGVVRSAAYTLAGVVAVAGVGIGVRRHRPAAPSAWVLLAAGLGCLVAGDAVYAWYLDVLHREPFPSPADALYLLAYPLLVAGLSRLVRARRTARDAAGAVDSAIVTVGLALLAWVFVAEPVVVSDAPVAERLLAAAYPLCDVVLLALIVRLVVGAGARPVSFRLLTASAAVLLGADTVYVSLATAELYVGGWLDGLWLLSYGLAGAAALHPSMRRLSEPGRDAAPFTRRRLVALTAVVLLGPALAVEALVTGAAASVTAAVAGGTAVLVALVVARMHLAVREVQRAERQRERLQGDLAHQAAHDHLTQVANRARTLEVVGSALHRGQRAGTLVGLLFVDLDHFKDVNDTWGHAAGDEVLRETARRIRAAVRQGDTVGRIGGDELVVLVEAPGSEAEVVETAERVLAAVLAPVAVPGVPRGVTVGASIGVAVARDGRTDADHLLGEADAAAYRAKAEGRGRVEVFDESLRRALRERAEQEAAIRRGLAAGEFVLHYQPVVDVADGRTVGYEALARWQRPGHGLLPPADFVPVAEESSLVCDLGRWVLGAATRQLAEWRADAQGRGVPVDDLTVAVNISGRHLASAAVVADVREALAASGLPADRLVVEVTETVLVDRATGDAHLRALRDLGVQVSIDDFGTGYTSIGQLQHLPASTLKIDRSLLAGGGAGSAELVALVVHAAHAFGLSVVAEGVETAEQLARLQGLGCDRAQGFLLCPPRAPEDLRQPGVALVGHASPT